MDLESLKTNSTVLRLIYLWAFIESGLGGFMHLLHIPLTGWILGGMSILLNFLLAKHSKVNAKQMLTGVGFVLLVKFALSPQSPIGAYVAVVFQGLLAILIFKLFSLRSVSVYIYASLVMLENAFQKPFMAFLIFGKELGEAIIQTLNKIIPNIDDSKPFLIGAFLLYLSVYTLWGIMIAYWTLQFDRRINSYTLPKDFQTSSFQKASPSIADIRMGTNTLRNLFFAIILIVSIGFAFFYDFYYALRVMALILFFAIVWPFLIKISLSHFKNSQSTSLNVILLELPAIRENFTKSYQYTSHYSGLKRWKEFVFLSLYLNVFNPLDAD